MSKRPNLAAALHDAGAKPTGVAQPPAPSPESAPEPVNPKQASNKAPSREGLRAVTTYVSTEAHAQLAMLAIERGQREKRKVAAQELMTEALNDLFRKYGRSGIA